jgi:hypothetical protein
MRELDIKEVELVVGGLINAGCSTTTTTTTYPDGHTTTTTKKECHIGV